MQSVMNELNCAVLIALPRIGNHNASQQIDRIPDAMLRHPTHKDTPDRHRRATRQTAPRPEE